MGLAAAAVGCSLDVPEAPLGGPLEVTIADPDQLAPGAAALRVVHLWSTREGHVAGVDVPLLAGESGLVLELTTPDEALWASLAPAGLVYPQRFPVTPTRIAVYDDLDGSGGFDPAIDRVLGLNQTRTPIVLRDVDAILYEFAEAQVDEYYALTDGRYTWLLVGATLGGVSYDGLPGSPAIPVTLVDDPTLGARLQCPPAADQSDWPSWEEVLAVLFGATKVHADQGLDPVAVCGGVATCLSENFERLGDPAAVPDTVRWCRQNGTLEALIAFSNRETCTDCECVIEIQTEAWVAAVGKTPSWWPCGSDVSWCESGAPLLNVVDACLLVAQ